MMLPRAGLQQVGPGSGGESPGPGLEGPAATPGGVQIVEPPGAFLSQFCVVAQAPTDLPEGQVDVSPLAVGTDIEQGNQHRNLV